MFLSLGANATAMMLLALGVWGSFFLGDESCQEVRANAIVDVGHGETKVATLSSLHGTTVVFKHLVSSFANETKPEGKEFKAVTG